MNTKYKYTGFILTRCLGLYSKMCATQMNTSDNPELWDIQLSSWLFCELTRQLCPCLMASSCYFCGFAYDARWELYRGLRQTSGHQTTH